MVTLAKYGRYGLALGVFLAGLHVQAQSLQADLEAYVRSCKAEIGVAVITDRGDTVCVNNERPYPMNSVLKLYQAVAVADALQRQGLPLDTVIVIGRGDLHPETYSPMRDERTSDTMRISVAELLRYALQQSDNNACDVLFERIVGLRDAEACVRALGVDHFAIRATEKDMFEDHGKTQDNWNRPLSAAVLIDRLFTRRLYAPVYQEFLKETLVACRTGQNRLAKPLTGRGVVIGHKTGAGFTTPDGYPSGINDVGFVRLPDGRHYAIAVFVRSSQCDRTATEQMIADVSERVYKYVVK